MAVAPIYKSNVRNPQPGSIDIAPIALPHLPAGEAITGALQDLGQTALRWHDQLKNARDTVNKANATTNYITQLDVLQKRYEEDPDYQTSPQRFADDQARLERETLAAAGLDPADQAVLQLTLRQQGIAAQGRVQSKSLSQHASNEALHIEDAEAQLGNLAARAGSPAERDTYVRQFATMVDEGVRAGLISAEAGGETKRRFVGTLQDSVIGNLIQQNPRGAQAWLADPNNTTHINPKRVVELQAAAASANDQLQIDQLTAKVTRNPEAASATLNRNLSPASAEGLFQNGIIPNEGGVDKKTGKGIVGDAGELGISQIMPDTARAVARSLGMTDLANMNDAQLKDALKDDHVLNQKLGQTYFNQQLAHYNGNVALAAAAYNAGPGRADAWRDAAVAKYGENFTAAQLISVITIPSTAAYVGRFYTHLGVPAEGVNLSPHGYYRAVTAVTTELGQQASAERQTIINGASANRNADPLIESMKTGAYIDDTRFNTALAINKQAANAGSTEAIAYVRELETLRKLMPAINAAWEMPPAQLATEIGRLEAATKASGFMSQSDVEMLQVFRTVQAEQAKNAPNDPVAAGERAHYYLPVPLDVAGSPEDPAFRQSLTYRGVQALAATGATAVAGGFTPKPFHPGEAEAFKQRFADAGLAEKVSLLEAMRTTLPGRVFSAAIDQMGLGAIEDAAAKFSDRPDLAKKILIGSTYLSAKGVDVLAVELRAAMQEQLSGDLWPPGSDQVKTVTDAAMAVYVADRGQNSSLWKPDNKDEIKKAIVQVTGELATRNGQRVAAPPGMTTATFNDTLSRLSDETLNGYGGAFDRNGASVSAAELGRIGVLKQILPGGSEYFVGTNKGSAAGDPFLPFLTVTHEPLVIDMAKAAATVPGAPAMPPSAGPAPVIVTPFGVTPLPSIAPPVVAPAPAAVAPAAPVVAPAAPAAAPIPAAPAFGGAVPGPRIVPGAVLK